MAQLYELSKPPSHYSLGYKTNNILHTLLRLGLSCLNAYLFKINVSHIVSPYCICKRVPESVKHYFLFCPRYVVQIEELEGSIKNVIIGYAKLPVNEKLAILLHGRSLNKTAGLVVAACVQNFIRNTKRFSSDGG